VLPADERAAAAGRALRAMVALLIDLPHRSIM